MTLAGGFLEPVGMTTGLRGSSAAAGTEAGYGANSMNSLFSTTSELSRTVIRFYSCMGISMVTSWLAEVVTAM